jgi:sec-independent protein translocase protein TatB
MSFLNIGGGELIVLILLIALLFGPEDIVRIMRTIGKYTRKLLQMWAQVSTTLKAELLAEELEETVEDVKASVKEAQDSVKEVQREMEQSVRDVNREMEESVRDVNREVEESVRDVKREVDEIAKVINEDIALEPLPVGARAPAPRTANVTEVPQLGTPLPIPERPHPRFPVSVQAETSVPSHAPFRPNLGVKKAVGVAPRPQRPHPKFPRRGGMQDGLSVQWEQPRPMLNLHTCKKAVMAVGPIGSSHSGVSHHGD